MPTPFAYCSGNPIYDSPGGRVIEFQQPVEMVQIDHSWVNNWVEVLPADGRGNLIFDSQQSYGDAHRWLRGAGGGSLKGQEHLVKHHDLLAVLVKDRRVFLLKTAHLSI